MVWRLIVAKKPRRVEARSEKPYARQKSIRSSAGLRQRQGCDHAAQVSNEGNCAGRQDPREGVRLTMCLRLNVQQAEPLARQPAFLRNCLGKLSSGSYPY